MARPAAGGKRRPGDRWQPVIGPRLTRRVAGRRELRLPPVELPRLDVRWRRLALPALLLAGLALGAWWLYRSPLLTVRDVSVEGTSAISAEIVREAAGLDGQSIFRADYDGARERVLALPLVKSVQIERDWPNGARIAVVERAPWGVWQAAGQSFVVDDEGVVLGLPAPAGAPTIVQTDAPASPLAAGSSVDPGAVAVAGRLVATSEQTLGRTVTALEFSQATGLTAVLGDLRAVFGDAQGYEFKLAALYAVLERAQAEGRAVQRVDLRFGDRVAYQ